MQALAQQDRSLRRHATVLARDAVAVLTGLRPAVMLDYAVLPPTTVHALGALLVTAAPRVGELCS